MKKLLIMGALIAFDASAACKWAWVDHDYSTMTPAIQKQVCESTIDINAVRTPSVRPIQQPQIKPIQRHTIPPIGTRRCRVESVYINGRWTDKQICR